LGSPMPAPVQYPPVADVSMFLSHCGLLCTSAVDLRMHSTRHPRIHRLAGRINLSFRGAMIHSVLATTRVAIARAERKTARCRCGPDAFQPVEYGKRNDTCTHVLHLGDGIGKRVVERACSGNGRRAR
jgi:hypothetical protein